MAHAIPLSASLFRQLTAERRRAVLSGLTETEAAVLLYDWRFWARENQLAPTGSWTHWLLLAGRGFGKTRTGAEWVRGLAETGQAGRIALVAPTAADARDTMVEGESGLLAISPPWCRPIYEPAKRRLTWANGAQAYLFSADEPDRLRGPQHDAAWCDELCAWRYDRAAWDMLMFGLRLGHQPRTCITTTPRPTPLIKELTGQKNVHMTHGTTFDNLQNLAPTFREDIVGKYEGTRLGRQELMAEILDDVPGALWSQGLIDGLRMPTPTHFEKIVVAVDPPVTAGEKADECGVVVAGLHEDGHVYILHDASTQGLSPLEWARSSVAAYHQFGAEEMVVEVNQGGDLVHTLLAQVDAGVKVTGVRADKAKLARAEPVALLYEQGRVHHTQRFKALEGQMCTYAPGVAASKSPDRMDALVWAVTRLLLQGGAPTLRRI